MERDKDDDKNININKLVFTLSGNTKITGKIKKKKKMKLEDGGNGDGDGDGDVKKNLIFLRTLSASPILYQVLALSLLRVPVSLVWL